MRWVHKCGGGGGWGGKRDHGMRETVASFLIFLENPIPNVGEKNANSCKSSAWHVFEPETSI